MSPHPDCQGGKRAAGPKQINRSVFGDEADLPQGGAQGPKASFLNSVKAGQTNRRAEGNKAKKPKDDTKKLDKQWDKISKVAC